MKPALSDRAFLTVDGIALHPVDSNEHVAVFVAPSGREYLLCASVKDVAESGDDTHGAQRSFHF